jgi:hypothetical protein
VRTSLSLCITCRVFDIYDAFFLLLFLYFVFLLFTRFLSSLSRHVMWFSLPFLTTHRCQSTVLSTLSSSGLATRCSKRSGPSTHAAHTFTAYCPRC